MRTGHLRVGIIGCGAVAEQGHLPAFAGFPNATVSVLVDRNLRRAGELAAKFRVPVVCGDYTDALTEMDAAIVALPHFLHAPVSIELLKRGIHVLVEKPMALTAAECEAMNVAAEESGAVLAAGLMRRYIRLNRWVKDAIAAGRIGRVLSFDVREGFVYNWPVASDFFFRKEAAGGGVLMDTGAHTLDTLIWWLGDVDSVRYFDDSYGGVEADCEAHLTMRSGATGIVELSRTRELRNTAILRGEKGTLEVPIYNNLLKAEPSRILAFESGGHRGDRQPVQSYESLFVLQLQDWVRAIAHGTQPAAPGREAARSIGVIERCYQERRPLDLPWMRLNSEAVVPS